MEISAIMTAKGAKALAEDFQKSVASRMSGAGTAETLDLLHTLREELQREMTAGDSASEEIGKLIGNMESIRFADEFRGYSERFKQLLAEQFEVRSSVNRIHELSCAFHEKLVSSALTHAAALLDQEGRVPPDTPWALFVSGELGRREVVLGERSSFFFVFQDCGPEGRSYYDDLALRFMAVLSVRFPSINRSMFKGDNLFWSGSGSEWEAFVAAPFKGATAGSSVSGGESDELLQSRMFETAADLRVISGDPELSAALLAYTGKLLAEEVSSERFWHRAKTIAEMPLALGIFGRFKKVRTGAHKGEISLKELAIDPLVASSRVLAIDSGITETSTVERIKKVLATGNLGVALADRLLVAYQDFMRQLVRIEINAGSSSDSIFLNPDDLDEVTRERIRAGLEDISMLQRLVYQQLVEVDH
jgi:CBS domain-containing protein